MLGDILSPQRVFMDLRPAAKAEILREMTRRLAALGEIQDADSVCSLLIERERLMTTGVKEGFAFPHVFSPQLDGLKLTVGIVRDGADYEALDGRPVEFILLLLGPLDHQDRHLRVLARLSRIATGPGILEALREAATPEEIVGLFSESDRLIAAAL